MNDCDLYHRWLGIPPHEQPPNHYRLLGITLFENDPAVVENAADQRLGYLRNFRTSEHNAAAERMLNEVTAAKICLLRPDRKAKYDAALHALLMPTPAPVAPASPPPLPASHLPASPTEEPEFVEPEYTPSTDDAYLVHRTVSAPAAKRLNPIVVLGPILGMVLVGLAIWYKNSTSVEPSDTNAPQVVRPVAEKPAVPDRTPHIAGVPSPPSRARSTWRLSRRAAQYKPRVVPIAESGIVDPPADRPNAAYILKDQFRFWTGKFQSQAFAEAAVLDVWRRGVAKSISRQLAILAGGPAQIVSPIVLHFDEDEMKIDVPIDANIPSGTLLYAAAWTDSKPAARKIVLQETPDPIAVTFDAILQKAQTETVVIRVTPKIGAGASAIPCNLKRLELMSDSLPGQIQDAKSKLDSLSIEISQTQRNYQDIVSRASHSNSAAAAASQSSAAAAKAHLQMLYGKQSSLNRSGTRWTTQLKELPDLIKAVKGFDGMTVQYRVYYLQNKREIVLLESGADSPLK